MANNPNEAPADNFFEQILRFPSFAPTEMGLAGPDGGLAETTAAAGASMMLQLNSVDGAGHLRAIGGGGVGAFHGQIFPLELSLEQGKGGFLKPEEASGSGKCFRDQVFRGQPIPATVAGAPHPPVMCPRVLVRRGQATDPHSIAEHLRGERIAERIRALQELVPSVNKDESSEGGRNQPAWEKWSNDGTERRVVKLMEENVGAAMQFLQSKALCIMPISLATASYHTQPPYTSSIVKAETNPPA